MGATKKYIEKMFVTCTMPQDTYNEIKELDGIKKLSVYDTNMYQHYKDNIEWQLHHEYYTLSKNKKKECEDKIHFNLLNK